MTDLRRGCIGAFVASGLYAGACNHGFVSDKGLVTMLIITAYAFIVSIALFGRKEA